MINTASIPAVAITFWILATFSVATWALIFVKTYQQLRAARRNEAYARQFWSAPNLQAASELQANGSAVAQLATAGFEVLRTPATGESPDLDHSWDRHDLLERNLRQGIQRERRRLESGLAVLATVGSTAPFVGLFGTVWGIMNAMRRIGALGNVSIGAVAGPIGEAPVATALGIGVAVPAVLAYNFLLRRLKVITAQLEDFAHDFFNLAQRATYRLPAPNRTPVRRETRGEDARGVELELIQSAVAGGANS
jgi:biopolymer transport protein ExbB